MFLRRALVVFTLGPLTLLLIYLGGWLYFLPFAALLGIAAYEYSQLVGKLGWRSPLWLLLPICLALWIVPADVQRMLFDERLTEFDLVSVVLLIGLFAAMAYALWLYEKRQAENGPASWMATAGGIMLLGWLGSYFFQLRGVGESAALWTALAMLGTWIADSGAYVFGKSLGKHKLAPRLSPNKTVEGYVGGILSGTLLTVVIAYFMDLPLATALALGLLVSVASPAGDLGVSMLKRSAGVKDSGTLLPGHGGALDRIDSLIWSVALAYFLVTIAG
ncbi:MAG TPA: phosphatidate cytidylyltransferase [Anaerolineae bacterium]|jgi:phosphatidate cytidylyltransferase|nr:phosphatidate cytidylyltransferase [Anaerolineae bacterium]